MLNRFIPEIPDISYRQLIEYGVHVGHSRATSSIFCAWMVVAFRQGLYVINLYKFLHMLRIGFVVLTHVVKMSGPIWFVNLDGSSDRYVKFPALECGEMSVCNFWICGMISNYETISNSYKQVHSRSIILKHRRHLIRDTNYDNWAYTRFTWPRAIFVSNVYKSYQPCKEALSLQIPCLGIVDTNAKSNVVSIAIPGNDESVDCLVFYNALISNFILYRKYSKLYKWFVSIRNKDRLITFQEWFTHKFSKNLALNHDLKLNLQGIFRFNYISTIIRGSTLFFCKSYWLQEIREKLVISPFYKDVTKYKTFLKLNRSSVLSFFNTFQNMNLVLANFCFMSFLTTTIFKFKASKWLKGNAWNYRHNKLNWKDGGPTYSSKSILRSFNLMRIFSKESFYMDYNSKILFASRLPVYWREMAYKFVGILLIFSCLKYLIFYSKRFYRSWPSWWSQLHSFQYPYYALKEPSKFLNMSLSIFRHEKQYWDDMISYSKRKTNLFRSIDPSNLNNIPFIQLPGKWFVNNTNPNIIPSLSGVLGLNAMFPFFNSTAVESRLDLKHALVINQSKKNNDLNETAEAKVSKLNSYSVKNKSVVKSLIGFNKLPVNSLFCVASWSLFSSISRYSWNVNLQAVTKFKKLLNVKFSNPVKFLTFSLLVMRLVLEPIVSESIAKLLKNYFVHCYITKLSKGIFVFRFILFYSMLFSNLTNSLLVNELNFNIPSNLNSWLYSRRWSKFDKRSLIFSWSTIIARKNDSLRWLY